LHQDTKQNAEHLGQNTMRMHIISAAGSCASATPSQQQKEQEQQHEQEQSTPATAQQIAEGASHR
jgi:hypothetical protein